LCESFLDWLIVPRVKQKQGKGKGLDSGHLL